MQSGAIQGNYLLCQSCNFMFFGNQMTSEWGTLSHHAEQVCLKGSLAQVKGFANQRELLHLS
jgi:hypothetical protein